MTTTDPEKAPAKKKSLLPLLVGALALLAAVAVPVVALDHLTVALVMLAGGHVGAASIAGQRFGLTLIGGIAVLAACLILPAILQRLYPGVTLPDDVG